MDVQLVLSLQSCARPKAGANAEAGFYPKLCVKVFRPFE